MAKLGDLIVRVGADTRGLNKSLGDVKKTMRQTTGNLTQMGKSLSMSLTAPILGLGALAVKAATDFEFSMAKVQAVSKFTGAEMERLESQAQELGATTSRSASDVAELQLELAKLGKSSTEIEQMTESVLSLSIAFDTELGETARVVGATLNQFGLDASESGRIADNMATLFGSSALDLEKFDTAMRTVGPTANAMGLSVEEAGAALGILVNAGVDASTAGTALTKSLTTLAKEGMTGAEAIEFLTTNNLSVADAFEKFGDRAGKIIPILKGTTGAFEDLTQKQIEGTGAAIEARKILEDTAMGGFDRLRSSVEALGISMGEALLPIVKKMADSIASFASKLAGMSDAGKTAVVVIGGMVAAIGPMLYVLPNLVNGLKLARVAMKKMNLAALANPYVLLGTAIAGAVAFLVNFIDKQNEAAKAALEHRRELALQAQAMQDAFGNTQTQSVDDLRKSVSLLQNEINKFSTNKIMEGLKIDPTKAFGGIKLGKGAEVLNPETKKKLLKNLQSSFSILTSQALQKGLFGDEATAFIEQGMAQVAEDTIAGYRNGLISKKAELEKALAAALGGESGSENVKDALAKHAVDYANELKNEFLKEIVDDNIDLNEAFFGKDDDLNIEPFFDELEEDIDDGTDAMIANFQELKDAATNAMMKAAQVSSFFGNAFGSAVADVVTGEKTAGQALKSFALNAIRALIALAKVNVIANATSPSNAANLLSGGLASPAFIVAGLSMLEGFIGGIAAFKDGGIVSGPTLGLVGEYPGASTNPEVIAPLDKLRSMLGGQSVVVTGKISGRDILLTSERNAIDRNRVRGF